MALNVLESAGKLCAEAISADTAPPGGGLPSLAVFCHNFVTLIKSWKCHFQKINFPPVC